MSCVKYPGAWANARKWKTVLVHRLMNILHNNLQHIPQLSCNYICNVSLCDNPQHTGPGQNVLEGIHRKSYSEAVIKRKETGGKGSGQNVMEGIERKSYSAAVIEGVRKRTMVFVGDSIVRKTDRVLNKGDDVVVCLSGSKI